MPMLSKRAALSKKRLENKKSRYTNMRKELKELKYNGTHSYDPYKLHCSIKNNGFDVEIYFKKKKVKPCFGNKYQSSRDYCEARLIKAFRKPVIATGVSPGNAEINLYEKIIKTRPF